MLGFFSVLAMKVNLGLGIICSSIDFECWLNVCLAGIFCGASVVVYIHVHCIFSSQVGILRPCMQHNVNGARVVMLGFGCWGLGVGLPLLTNESKLDSLQWCFLNWRVLSLHAWEFHNC